MRAAPPVDAALAAGRAERMLITLLHALAGLAVAFWAAALAGLTGLAALVACALAAAVTMAAIGFWLARRALPPDAGRLRWDGQAWRWLSSAGPAELPLARLEIAIDLGNWALLRLHPADGGRALWRLASARTAGAAWHGLRVALVAHAGELAGLAGTPAGPR